ncbi:MAG: tetratricopeptide repeat protein, partial [Planctomycetes bacterium]|nr:tetratricopeptide repeat protein [Planctomycetota bacterium]
LAAFARDFLERTSLEAGHGIDYTVREALDVAAARIADETFDDPEIEAELRELIGSTYCGLSQPVVAELHLRRAIASWRAAEGPASRRAVGAMMTLVIALREQGRSEDAMALVDEAEQVFPEDGREHDPQWWQVQHNRAYVLRHQGRLRDAHDLFVAVRAARERLLGEHAPPTIRVMHNLGVLQLGLGDAEGAERVLAEAVRRGRAADHPRSSLLQIEDNLAEAWRELGRLDDAARKHRETMQGFAELFGDDHQITIGCGYHLLKVLHRQGDADRLHALATDLLGRCERAFGDDDYRTMDVLQALAAAKNGLGDAVGAAALMARAYDAVARARGALHPATFRAGRNLTLARLAAGDVDGALEVTAELLGKLTQVEVRQLPAACPGETWLARANALDAAGRADEGRRAAAAAVDALVGAVPAEHPLLREARARAGR